MQYIWSRIIGGNFGDNLNSLLWKVIMADVGSVKPGQAVYGIGSFKDIVIPEKVRKVHVMGSGFAGPPFAPDVEAKPVRFHFVRGPHTAAAWGYKGGAIADGAVMLTQTYLRDLVPERTTELVGYVPHHISDQMADYEYICRQAGVRYIGSKGYDTEGFIRKLKSCDCIITEALHGAIVADLFRKPWVAVSSRRHINPYKWNDWCQSVGMSYEPCDIDFVCTRGLRTVDRLLNSMKRAVSAVGVGKDKWKYKNVFYDSRAAEDTVAGQITLVKERANYSLSATMVRDQMVEQTGEILSAFKREVAA